MHAPKIRPVSLSLCILLCLLLLTTPLLAGDRITGKAFATRSEVIAPRGMAATSQPLATQAALDVLKKGGSAVDAAIAANALLGLVEPTGNGMGGDLFAIVWDAETQKLYGLNASGRSPYELTLDYFKDNGHESIPAYGPLPVTVPGCVDGWFALHGKFGKLPMSDVLAPAISYAENGFPLTELIAYYWNLSVPRLSKYPGFSDTFTLDGRAPQKGEMFRNPRLAKTLRTLATDGRDAFYRGEIAKKIVDYMQANGGFLTMRDFEDHTSTWIEPVSTNYRGYDVWQLPPNGQGIAVLQLLNLLEPHDLASYGFGSVEYVHAFVEAKKLVFEDRAKYYADMDFADVPVEELISKEYAENRAKLIDMARAQDRVEAGNPALEEGDTIYLTAADQDGNMVSLIQSNYRGMGSGMTPGDLGFILQDRGELFSLEPGHRNVYEPHKRPFHTIIPGFVTKDGEPYMSFGVMGGATQPQGQAQILINMIDFGMNLQEAGDAPRILHSGSSQPTGEVMTDGGTVFLETGFPYETERELVKMGHTVSVNVGSHGGYQAILWDGNVYFGASESRKDGQAAGY